MAMNRLSPEKRALILGLLCEGSSLRAASRLADVSINTVTKLLVDAGKACMAYHDQFVRRVQAKRVQVDEIWTFTHCKERNVAGAKAAPEGAGDTWTWTAIDAETKLIVSYFVGDRDAESALEFMHDLRSRLRNRVQLTSDGLNTYLDAVEAAFGDDVDYAQLVKIYGEPRYASGPDRRYSPGECCGARKRRVVGNPNPAKVSTSFVERQNLTMRMHRLSATRTITRLPKEAHFPWPVSYSISRPASVNIRSAAVMMANPTS
jgi:IS1 family transposase